jgi:hypothetical protein
MTVEEARIRLRTQLEEMLGVTEASILLDRPPGGWNELATKVDLAALEARIDRRFEEMDRRFELRFADMDRHFDEMDRRCDEMDRRFDEMDRRFDGFDTTMELRIESAVNRAVASQTRWIFGALIALIPILAVINRL